MQLKSGRNGTVMNASLLRVMGGSLCLLAASGCFPDKGVRVVPAVEYTHAVKDGVAKDYSFFEIAQKRQEEHERAELEAKQQERSQEREARGALHDGAQAAPAGATSLKTLEQSDNRYTEKGLSLKKSITLPETESSRLLQNEFAALKATLPAPPVGSSSPYYMGQMTANPSLWPDESQQNSLFRDLRAFQPMDVVTIVINESVEGQKKTQTDSQSRFTLLVALENLFSFLGPGTGENTPTWNANNPGLDEENIINAQTNSIYQGTGQTRRQGSLRGKLSAMVLEVLPNGLLRLEGTKIVAVDHEEEVMVVSGLARLRDIDSLNQIDSARIANMRIDFYGKGVVGDVTQLGWGTRLVRQLWPF